MSKIIKPEPKIEEEAVVAKIDESSLEKWDGGEPTKGGYPVDPKQDERTVIPQPL